jgi:hypothetical protein
MSKKQKFRYLVHLGATLPATATLEVEAENEEAAREYAETHATKANWAGSDYSTPSNCDIEIGDIEEIE